MVQKNRGKLILVIIIIFIFSTISFCSGFLLNNIINYFNHSDYQIKKEIIDKSDTKITSTDINFNLFWQVWETLTKQAVEQPISEKDLFYGALAGMTASIGDPYSIFLNPEQTKEFNNDINGTFDGIGAEIDIKDDNLIIVSPLPKSPAESAGLLPNDRILAINDIDTKNLSIDAAIKQIRGEKGTNVKLTILRNELETKEYNIIRDTIKIESVEVTMKSFNDKKLAKIKINSFNPDTSKIFNEEIQDILLEKPDGIILDLRNNAGGLLSESVEVASAFIKSGNIVVEKSNNNQQKEYKANGNAQLEGYKVVVLINNSSASAAEIVAGALQDAGVATLVGETSFGKGSVQDYQQFADGSSLKLTVAYWYTPKMRCINKEGITPDFEVTMTEEDYQNEEDPQFDKAVDLLIQ